MKRNLILIFLVTNGLAIGAMITPSIAEEVTVFTYRAPESEKDLRYTYDTEALRLALEKTKAKYGPFKLVSGPVMTFNRVISEVSEGKIPNYFFKVSYEGRFENMNMGYAQFPVDLGIVGWRACFTNAAGIEKLKKVKTLDDLKRLTHGQGQGWSDVQILREQGFTVDAVASYESLFKMTAAGRFDLFCRGTNELLDEWEGHKDIEGLTYDKTITIQYPLPRFFYTNAANKAAIQRVQEGLVLAYKDGSLQKAWKQNYQASIDFVALNKRKVFRLENPLLKTLKFDYKQYFYDPYKRN